MDQSSIPSSIETRSLNIRVNIAGFPLPVNPEKEKDGNFPVIEKKKPAPIQEKNMTKNNIDAGPEVKTFGTDGPDVWELVMLVKARPYQCLTRIPPM